VIACDNPTRGRGRDRAGGPADAAPIYVAAAGVGHERPGPTGHRTDVPASPHLPSSPWLSNLRLSLGALTTLGTLGLLTACSDPSSAPPPDAPAPDAPAPDAPAPDAPSEVGPVTVRLRMNDPAASPPAMTVISTDPDGAVRAMVDADAAAWPRSTSSLAATSQPATPRRRAGSPCARSSASRPVMTCWPASSASERRSATSTTAGRSRPSPRPRCTTAAGAGATPPTGRSQRGEDLAPAARRLRRREPGGVLVGSRLGGGPSGDPRAWRHPYVHDADSADDAHRPRARDPRGGDAGDHHHDRRLPRRHLRGRQHALRRADRQHLHRDSPAWPVGVTPSGASRITGSTRRGSASWSWASPPAAPHTSADLDLSALLAAVHRRRADRSGDGSGA
jgi:hypothetical protein